MYKTERYGTAVYSNGTSQVSWKLSVGSKTEMDET